ncbi:MAG: sensor domain-containing diguanylate cyclase [Actinomycetota bacterium]|nr:sensor domain-containing diguanylate cyclase [Actinomycetota bacterium]
MGWFQRSLDKQIRLFYLPLITGVSVAFALMADLPTFNKSGVVLILLLTAIVHWDLRDGGVLSRWLYSHGAGYDMRSYITVSVAFGLVTLILGFANAFYTPLIMLYYIPIVLCAMRGGYRMTLLFVGILAASTSAYYQVGYQVYGRVYKEGNLYLLLFLGLALASGFIADRLRRAAVDLSALYETGRALNSTLNVSEIYALALNIISMDLAPDVSALFMIDSQKHLQLQAHRGLDDSRVKELSIEIGRGLIGKVAETRTPMSISETNRKWQLSFAPDIISVMAVPVRVGEKLLGVMMVGKRMAHAYGYENLRFLEALGSQAAISIQNAWLYRQTKEWASLDALTGIYNYRYFSERLDSEWSRALRYEKPLSFIMIDVDLFKQVNDNYGHLCGDEVLREIAHMLKKHTRDTDIVARYGGEEFVIILPETHYQDAYVAGEKLRRSIYEATFTGGNNNQKIKLTISLGIANYPSTAFSKSDLIYQADQALYQAKIQRNTLASPLDTSCQINLNPSEIS